MAATRLRIPKMMVKLSLLFWSIIGRIQNRVIDAALSIRNTQSSARAAGTKSPTANSASITALSRISSPSLKTKGVFFTGTCCGTYPPPFSGIC